MTTEITVVGSPRAPETEALWQAVAQAYLPHRVLVATEPGEASPLAPACERAALDGRATAYVCRNLTCFAPVMDADALRALLREANTEVR